MSTTELEKQQLKTLQLIDNMSTTEQISTYVENLIADKIEITSLSNYLSKSTGGTISNDLNVSGDLEIGGNVNINGIDKFFVNDKTIAEALNVDQAKTIIENRYTTKFEVLPLSADLQAGTTSDLSVDIYRLCLNANKFESTLDYDAGQIIFDYDDSFNSCTIYQAKNNISAGSEFNISDWDNVTSTFIGKNSEDVLCHKYVEQVPTNTTAQLKIRSAQIPNLQNVVIEWGDGEKTYLKNAKTESETPDNYVTGPAEKDDYELSYNISHTYDNKWHNTRMIVTITGSTYWGLQSGNTTETNIVSRLWDTDLVWYDGVENIASFAKNSRRLLSIKVPAYYPMFSTMTNIANAFFNCVNLQHVFGMTKYAWNHTMRSIGNTFDGCKTMLNNDMRLPASSTAASGSVFRGCSKMSTQLVNHLPVLGFESRQSLGKYFQNCKSMTNKDNAADEYLWNDTYTHFINTKSCFNGCNSQLLKDVPTGWK